MRESRPGESRTPLRCAIVPPAPAPYREPLFRGLAQRLTLCVVYQSEHQPSWDAGAGWAATEHDYPARHLRSWQHRRPGRSPIVWPRGLERALAAHDPDCVVAWEYGPASLRVLRWCRRHGRACVVFTECTPAIDAMLSAPQLRLHRAIARRADGAIAVSSAARERLLSFGVPAERIAVALQSADLAPIRAAAPEPLPAAGAEPGADRPLIVLSVARLVPDKNLATLIEAFAQASRTSPPAALEIVGTGFEEPALRALARRLGVAVRFHGAVAPRELPALYASADIFALVSLYEPFGVAVREAAAAGLPIVCSRVAGAAGDVALDGRNAILIDPERRAEIADALSRLLADAGERERMGAESRAVDLATDGGDVDAFVGAVTDAARRRGRAPLRA